MVCDVPLQPWIKWASKPDCGNYDHRSHSLRRGEHQIIGQSIHWVKLNIRYNIDLIQDWLQNRADPAAHQKAIANYQASLLSNQPKPKQRKSS
jgi:hypothetical protein